MDSLCYPVLFCYAFIHVCMLMPCGKGLTSWLSFVMSHFDVDILLLVSWDRFGA